MTTTNNAVNVTLSGQTGTGTFVGSTSPSLTTPNIGAASATSINFGGSTLSTYTAATSWTPTFTFGTVGNLSVSYAIQTGYYLQVGGVVFFQFALEFTPTFTTSSGNAIIASFPITVNSLTSNMTTILINNSTNLTYATGCTALNGQMTASSTNMTLVNTGSAKNEATLTTANFTTATQYYFFGSGLYFS